MVFMMLNLKLLINLGNQTYVSTHQHDDGGTMIVSFEQHDASILVTGQCHDQDWQYWTGGIEFFHEGHKEFYFVTSLQWCRMASWCVTMVDRMVRDRSSTNHKIMFPVLAMASSYAKMAVIQSRPRRAYAGSILSSLKTFQREDVRKIDSRGVSMFLIF